MTYLQVQGLSVKLIQLLVVCSVVFIKRIFPIALNNHTIELILGSGAIHQGT